MSYLQMSFQSTVTSFFAEHFARAPLNITFTMAFAINVDIREEFINRGGFSHGKQVGQTNENRYRILNTECKSNLNLWNV